MNAIANILVALVAALHVYFLALEMFFSNSVPVRHSYRIAAGSFTNVRTKGHWHMLYSSTVWDLTFVLRARGGTDECQIHRTGPLGLKTFRNAI